MKSLSILKLALISFFLFEASLLGQTCGEKTEKKYDEITTAELLKLINRKEDFLLIDNRTQKEYDEGHIPGAILIPVDSYTFGKTSPVAEEIQKIREKENADLNFILKDGGTNEEYISDRLLASFLRLMPNDRDKLMILYDRKPTCTRSPTFFHWLRILGYRNVKRYVPAWAGWKKSGYPIEKELKRAK